MKRSSWMTDAGFESSLAAEAKAKSPLKRADWMSEEGFASRVRAEEMSQPGNPEKAGSVINAGTLAVVGAIVASVIVP